MNTSDYSNYRYWINDVKDDADKELFNEIITCIDTESYRSAAVMIWVLCAESLQKRLKQLAQNNKSIKKDLKTWNKDKNEAELLKLCKKHDLISESDCNHLNLIRKARNRYAHPNNVTPEKERVLAYLFFALNSVLSKSSQYSYLEAKNLLNLLLSDPIQLGNKNTLQIRSYARNLISKLNPNIHEPILKLLFKLTEKLFNDFNVEKQKCIDIGLILIKELILADNEIIDESKCSEFLNNSKITSCNVFSEIEIWELIDENTRYKTFKYSSNFESEIFSEIDFITTFHKLNENDLLDTNLKEDFNKILDETPIDLVLNCDISTETKFEKIINNFKSYDWYIQNPTAKLVRQINLNQFNDKQLEIIGRNLLQAADGGSRGSKTSIEYILRNYNNNIPKSLIKGIAFEVFVNEKNEFRLKENYFRKIIIAISRDEFHSIYNELLDAIKNSNAKNNRFYQFTESIRKLQLVNDKLKMDKIDKIIKTIEKSRCKSIKKIIYENPEEILNFNSSEDIAPHVFKCLDESQRMIFKNLFYEDAIKFVTFFSISSQSIGTRRYKHLNVKFDLIKDFIDINELETVVKENMDNNPTPEKESFFKLFFENLENYN